MVDRRKRGTNGRVKAIGPKQMEDLIGTSSSSLVKRTKPSPEVRERDRAIRALANRWELKLVDAAKLYDNPWAERYMAAVERAFPNKEVRVIGINSSKEEPSSWVSHLDLVLSVCLKPCPFPKSDAKIRISSDGRPLSRPNYQLAHVSYMKPALVAFMEEARAVQIKRNATGLEKAAAPVPAAKKIFVPVKKEIVGTTEEIADVLKLCPVSRAMMEKRPWLRRYLPVIVEASAVGPRGMKVSILPEEKGTEADEWTWISVGARNKNGGPAALSAIDVLVDARGNLLPHPSFPSIPGLETKDSALIRQALLGEAIRHRAEIAAQTLPSPPRKTEEENRQTPAIVSSSIFGFGGGK